MKKTILVIAFFIIVKEMQQPDSAALVMNAPVTISFGVILTL
jgi:hypothetical protein